MSIYAILASKPHNPHYLNRYIRFIEGCQKVNESYTGYTEKHHICPKAKDLFPEYTNLAKNKWNCIRLTPRQHFVAHLILQKCYPDNNSMSLALFRMSRSYNKINSYQYEILSEKSSNLAKENNRKMFENGTHPFIGLNEKRLREGTHHWLGDGEYQRNVQKNMVKNGTHPFLGGKIQKETNRKRLENGTHHLLSGEIQRKTQRKRVENGTHNCLGVVNCYNKEGFFVRVPKEDYHSQSGAMEDREYVHFNTKEGKRRKQKFLSKKVLN